MVPGKFVVRKKKKKKKEKKKEKRRRRRIKPETRMTGNVLIQDPIYT